MFTVASATPVDQNRRAIRRRLRRRPAAQTWPIDPRRSLLGRLRDCIARVLVRLLASLLTLAPVALLLSVVAVLGVDAGRSPRPAAQVDPDDTHGCPVEDGCESCGAVDDLAVGTADTPVGVLCLTLCGSCAEAGDLPSFSSWSAAIRRVGEHAGHLGTDVDELALATVGAVRSVSCPRCTSVSVADLGGWSECRECGHGFAPATGVRGTAENVKAARDRAAAHNTLSQTAIEVPDAQLDLFASAD